MRKRKRQHLIAQPQPSIRPQTSKIRSCSLRTWAPGICKFAANLAERQILMIPAEDPDFEYLDPAFPPWAAPGRDAIPQPPKPLVRPSEQILDHLANYEADVEASA